jgi:hypothetical protein
MEGVLLAADGIDRRLYQAAAVRGATTLREVPGRAIMTGSVPNQLLVDGDLVYLVNAASGTLQVIARGPPDGDAGLALSTVNELVLGPNTYPEGLVKVGTSLWVPLYGGVGAASAALGQRVVEVDITEPRNPRVIHEVSLTGIDLKPFDGGAPVARPWAITALDGDVFVALNNLDPVDYRPLGPGLVARINPLTRALRVLDLGASCLNPQWVAPLGGLLAVTCGGRASFDMQTFRLLAIEGAGAVVIDVDGRRLAQWQPEPVRCADAASCPLFLPGRFAVVGQSLFVADQNAGQVAVLDASDAGLTLRRALLPMCPLDSVTGIANVSDVLVP